MFSRKELSHCTSILIDLIKSVKHSSLLNKFHWPNNFCLHLFTSKKSLIPIESTYGPLAANGFFHALRAIDVFAGISQNVQTNGPRNRNENSGPLFRLIVEQVALENVSVGFPRWFIPGKRAGKAFRGMKEEGAYAFLRVCHCRVVDPCLLKEKGEATPCHRRRVLSIELKHHKSCCLCS